MAHQQNGSKSGEIFLTLIQKLSDVESFSMLDFRDLSDLACAIQYIEGFFFSKQLPTMMQQS